jgi:uroporphyrin-III C-methyltransferase
VPDTLIAAGEVWLVGAGPGDPDLLTRKAEKLIAAASIVFYDALVGQGVLELIPDYVARVSVGKRSGRHSKDQASINDMILAAAQNGHRVVRLKGGDPGIFGRATEEMQAAHAAGLPVEIVPGVTAAFAAAAGMGVSLTQRGVSDTLVFATGASRDGDALPDWSRHALPGTTLVFYMGVRSGAGISANLLASGLPASTVVRVVAEASTAQEGRFTATLGNLAEDLAAQNITGSAVIFLTVPKTAQAAKVRQA